LSVDERPQWRVISQGSRSYVDPITQPYKERIKLNTPVTNVERKQDGINVHTAKGEVLEFDQVVLACHSDQALRMLDKPSKQESEILGALPYQMSEVVLHTDTRLMPKKELAWASWNYHIPQRANDCAMVTYNMNILQNFHYAEETFLVTLNRGVEIDPKKIIKTYQYAHPVFTQDGIRAQHRYDEINAHNRTHFCGAYWFNGFHEDGVNSALRVAKSFGITL
ncbi:MAG: putative NAD/FAD-binding protein, partial [Oleiphilaceae bacterium]